MSTYLQVVCMQTTCKDCKEPSTRIRRSFYTSFSDFTQRFDSGYAAAAHDNRWQHSSLADKIRSFVTHHFSAFTQKILLKALLCINKVRQASGQAFWHITCIA